MSLINNDLSFFDSNLLVGKHQNPYTISPFSITLLKEAIESSGLKGGLVYHSASVLYDANYGNKLLTDKVKNNNLFRLVWIAIPETCGSSNETDDFIQRINENKISAVKVFPRYHGFSINTGTLDILLQSLDERKIPLIVDQEEILWEEIAYILDKYHNIPFILENTGYRLERFIEPFFERYENFYFGISRYQAHGGIEFICNKYGSERLLFGSGMPVFSPEPIMMMVNLADISFEEKQNIASNNILKLLDHD